MKIESVNHVSFEVENMDQSLSFYRDLLGFNVLDVSGRDPEFSERVTKIKDVNLKIAYLQAGNFKVELIQYDYPGKLPLSERNESYTHLCLNVAGLRDFYRANKIRIKFIDEPLEIPGGPNKGGYMVYFFDPDKNKIEFIEPPESRKI